MNSKLMLSAAMATAMLGFAVTSAYAHGKPEHGGAFTEVKEYTFEVVPKEQGEEPVTKTGKEKQPHEEQMEFTLYIKDPSLKPVTSGSGSLKISEGSKQVATATLSSSGDTFKANAILPHHGRYRIAIDFAPPGQRPIKATVPIKVE
jgi:hypothetical protein